MMTHDHPELGPRPPWRHRAAGIAAAPAVVMAVISLGRAAWTGWVRPHPTWDDHALVGAAWGLAAFGLVVLVESVASVVTPARWYPRWLAILVLLTAIGVGIYAGDDSVDRILVRPLRAGRNGRPAQLRIPPLDGGENVDMLPLPSLFTVSTIHSPVAQLVERAAVNR